MAPGRGHGALNHPPTLLLLTLIAEVGLHLVAPVAHPVEGVAGTVAGALVVAVGAALAAAGSRAFERAGTPVRPFRTPTTLVTTGLYRVSRNPMYLGLVILAAGVALALGSATPWAAVLGLAALLDRRFIRPEEGRLARTFGRDYDAYRGRVRRWI